MRTLLQISSSLPIQSSVLSSQHCLRIRRKHKTTCQLLALGSPEMRNSSVWIYRVRERDETTDRHQATGMSLPSAWALSQNIPPTTATSKTAVACDIARKILPKTPTPREPQLPPFNTSTSLSSARILSSFSSFCPTAIFNVSTSFVNAVILSL